MQGAGDIANKDHSSLTNRLVDGCTCPDSGFFSPFLYHVDESHFIQRQGDITYRHMLLDAELLEIMPLIERDLSEPYTIWVFRYFTSEYPRLCILAHDQSQVIESDIRNWWQREIGKIEIPKRPRLVGVIIGRINYEGTHPEEVKYQEKERMGRDLREPGYHDINDSIKKCPICLPSLDNNVCKMDWLKPFPSIQSHLESHAYIGMLTVDKDYRRQGIASNLVNLLLNAIPSVDPGIDRVVLETECSNKAALKMYAKQGFIRTEFLPKYYAGGRDAFRLELLLSDPKMDPEMLSAEEDISDYDEEIKTQRDEVKRAEVKSTLQKLLNNNKTEHNAA